MSVFEDAARIRRTSGESWVRKSALNSVFGSAFKFFMCCRSSDGFLSPEPFRFNNSWSFSACVLPKALVSAAFYSVIWVFGRFKDDVLYPVSGVVI